MPNLDSGELGRVATLLGDGDQIEQETWGELRDYLGKYELIWRKIIVPLRTPGSIYLRRGIDGGLENFAMNNYTAYVNMARAWQKINNDDELKFPEEIWSNLQRTVEVAIKAADAFSRLYRECMGNEFKIDTQKLDKTEASVKEYRNRLHDPMQGTLKDEQGVRLIPLREKIEDYYRWTTVMYEPNLSDFVSVQSQLSADFFLVCSSLQDLWTQIELALPILVKNRRYQLRSSAPSPLTTQPSLGTIDVDSSASGVCFGAQGPVQK